VSGDEVHLTVVLTEQFERSRLLLDGPPRSADGPGTGEAITQHGRSGHGVPAARPSLCVDHLSRRRRNPRASRSTN
jgi:hypothetical protein